MLLGVICSAAFNAMLAPIPFALHDPGMSWLAPWFRFEDQHQRVLFVFGIIGLAIITIRKRLRGFERVAAFFIIGMLAELACWPRACSLSSSSFLKRIDRRSAGYSRLRRNSSERSD